MSLKTLLRRVKSTNTSRALWNRSNRYRMLLLGRHVSCSPDLLHIACNANSGGKQVCKPFQADLGLH